MAITRCSAISFKIQYTLLDEFAESRTCSRYQLYISDISLSLYKSLRNSLSISDHHTSFSLIITWRSESNTAHHGNGEKARFHCGQYSGGTGRVGTLPSAAIFLVLINCCDNIIRVFCLRFHSRPSGLSVRARQLLVGIRLLILFFKTGSSLDARSLDAID